MLTKNCERIATALTFRESDHTYWLDGKPVPNVTRVLDHFKDHGMANYQSDQERARQEGTAIHKMIELALSGKLDYVPVWLESYHRAFYRFLSDTNFEFEASELRLMHPTMRYAGTCDLIGHITFQRRRQHVLIDVKRSFAGGSLIGLQLAAYAGAYNVSIGYENGDMINRRFALRFKPDKLPPYQLKEFSDRADFDNFNALLKVYRLLENGR